MVEQKVLPKCKDCTPCSECPTWFTFGFWTRHDRLKNYLLALILIVISYSGGFFTGQDNVKAMANRAYATLNKHWESGCEYPKWADPDEEQVREAQFILTGKMNIQESKDIVVQTIPVPLNGSAAVPGTDFVIGTKMPKGTCALYRLWARLYRPSKSLIPTGHLLANPLDPEDEWMISNNYDDNEADCPQVLVDDRFLFHVEGLDHWHNDKSDPNICNGIVYVQVIDLGGNEVRHW